MSISSKSNAALLKEARILLKSNYDDLQLKLNTLTTENRSKLKRLHELKLSYQRLMPSHCRTENDTLNLDSLPYFQLTFDLTDLHEPAHASTYLQTLLAQYMNYVEAQKNYGQKLDNEIQSLTSKLQGLRLRMQNYSNLCRSGLKIPEYESHMRHMKRQAQLSQLDTSFDRSSSNHSPSISSCSSTSTTHSPISMSLISSSSPSDTIISNCHVDSQKCHRMNESMIPIGIEDNQSKS